MKVCPRCGLAQAVYMRLSLLLSGYRGEEFESGQTGKRRSDDIKRWRRKKKRETGRETFFRCIIYQP